MDNSILNSIKKLLGISPDYTQFDQDIIIHINSIFNILSQLGCTKIEGYSISDDTSTWDEIIDDGTDLDVVKSYVYLRVRMIFDPPTGAASETFKETIKELEWRIMVKEDE